MILGPQPCIALFATTGTKPPYLEPLTCQVLKPLLDEIDLPTYLKKPTHFFFFFFDKKGGFDLN